jgi:hypothetical protein
MGNGVLIWRQGQANARGSIYLFFCHFPQLVFARVCGLHVNKERFSIDEMKIRKNPKMSA